MPCPYRCKPRHGNRTLFVRDADSRVNPAGETQPLEDAMRWTVEEVARALGVTPPGGVDPLARLAGVSINSRTLARGELFVAIHGPRHDGHNFVVAALDAGALAGVVAADRFSGYDGPHRSKLLAVPDTLAALQVLAQ